MNITVLGAGSYGTTLGQILDDNNCNVLLYDVNKDNVDIINNKHQHPLFDFKINLSESIIATTDFDKALSHADIFVISVPTKFMRGLLEKVNEHLDRKVLFINASKGVEPDSGLTNSQLINEVIDKKYISDVAIITGPSHAEELIKRKLTVLSAVSLNQETAIKVQELFNNTDYLRVYYSTDLIGAEIGGAVKNAIAFISGLCDGLGFGINARSALITRGMIEMVRIVEWYGGSAETAYGLTGLGDLIVTASSTLSRNFTAGRRVGMGESIEKVVLNSKMTVEGVRSIRACYKLVEDEGLYLPIITVAYKVLFEKLDLNKAMSSLLEAELKPE